MTAFRYFTTDLVTGEVLADNIPLTVQSFSQQLNGGGQLTGSLPLSEDFAVNRPYIEALECRRAVLWVLADDYPVWAGVIWDWPDMSRQEGTLPINAQTIDSVFGKRLIIATLEYHKVDVFQVFIDLALYGTTFQSSYITSYSPVKGPPSSLVGQQAAIARLVFPSGPAATAGFPYSVGYLYSDLATVQSAWQTMTQTGVLEYVFDAGLDSSGNPAIFLRLGWAQLGRGYTETPYAVVYPGNALDYGWQRTGSQGANYIVATAPPNGALLQWESIYPAGVDLGDLEAGYPVLQGVVSWEGSLVTAQSQVDAFANGSLPMQTQAMITPLITIGGDGFPSLTDLVLGDTFMFAATSPLHPPANNQPGLQQLLRLTGWTCYPPTDQQSQRIQLQTSAVVLS